jgi:hypothetical protein
MVDQDVLGQGQTAQAAMGAHLVLQGGLRVTGQETVSH